MSTFLYKSSHWKNKMLNADSAESKLQVAGNFAHTAITFFTEVAVNHSGKILTDCLKEIDKHSRWMVASSDGICEGYRLTSDWMRTIIAQITLDGAQANGETDSGCEKVICRLWGAMGWNAELSIRPRHTDTHTLYPIRYDNNGEQREFNIILEPTSEFPIGAMYQALNGTQWAVIEVLDTSIICEGQQLDKTGNYRVASFGFDQLRGWIRVN
ncbi:MAG: hypothetical protein GY781_10765 [Gammaproteobacteria bacterium]|nr:hypothetical protein [Gammaproteobacteria bacterium]